MPPASTDLQVQVQSIRMKTKQYRIGTNNCPSQRELDTLIIKKVRFCGCPGTSGFWTHRLGGGHFKFTLPHKGVTYGWEVLWHM